jgi:murein L,D-transpeptidase YcbB/YkuD
MSIYQDWGADAKEIDPYTVDWSRITARNFSFWLRQDPGPKNPLGQIKFMFPNKFNIYLHDTPSKDAFSKSVRSFSSGCIRIENPIELAEFLLREDPGWTPKKIRVALEKNAEKTIRLSKPIPVHLLYLTVWIDDKGVAHFRKDIYGRDKRLDDALRKQASDTQQSSDLLGLISVPKSAVGTSGASVLHGNEMALNDPYLFFVAVGRRKYP